MLSVDTIKTRPAAALLALGTMHGHADETPQHDAALTLYLDASAGLDLDEVVAFGHLTDILHAVRTIAYFGTRETLGKHGRKRVLERLATISGGNA